MTIFLNENSFYATVRKRKLNNFTDCKLVYIYLIWTNLNNMQYSAKIQEKLNNPTIEAK